MELSWIAFVLLACSRLTLQHNLARNNLANTAFTTPNSAGLEDNYNDDQVYLLNSVLDVSWFTNFTSYSVYLWQQDLVGGSAAQSQAAIFNKSESDPENGGFPWQVEPGTTDLSISNVYFLALGQTNNLDGSATCHYFNITANAADIPTSQSSSATSSPTPASTATSPATSTTGTTSITSTPTSSTTTTPKVASASTSNGAKIGLGVGLGVGIPIILLLAGMLFLKIRQDRRRLQNRADPYETAPPQYPPQYPMTTSKTGVNYNQPYTPQERSSDGYAYELPAPPKPR